MQSKDMSMHNLEENDFSTKASYMQSNDMSMHNLEENDFSTKASSMQSNDMSMHNLKHRLLLTWRLGFHPGTTWHRLKGLTL